MRTIRETLETASSLVWLALLGVLFSLCHMTPAQAQTYAPRFTLTGIGTVEVTSNQVFDYKSSPPAEATVQLHNGPNPECQFSAVSNTGAAQYRSIGGSNGYDSKGGYTDPAAVHIPLPVPIIQTLTLACGASGTIKATLTTEAPPPAPVCPCGPIPGGPLPVTPTPAPPPPATLAVTPKATPTPARAVPKPVPKPVVPAPAPKPDPVPTPTPTPPEVVQTASPMSDPTPSPSPTPVPDHVSYDAGAKVVKSVAHHGHFPTWIFLVALIVVGGGCIVLFRRRQADRW